MKRLVLGPPTRRHTHTFANRALLGLTVAVLPFLSACGSFYFHDPKIETSLTQAKTDLVAASPDTVIEQQRAYLKTLAETERDSVTRNFIARRDLRLAIWLSPSSDTKGKGWTLMGTEIETRARNLAGSKWETRVAGFEAEETLLNTFSLNIVNDRKNIDAAAAVYAAHDAVKAMKAKDGKKKEPSADKKKAEDRHVALCNAIKDDNGVYIDNPFANHAALSGKEQTAAEDAFDKFERYKSACQGFDPQYKAITQILAGYRDSDKYGGFILDAATELDAIETRIKEAEAEAERQACLLKAAVKEYDDAAKKDPDQNLDTLKADLLKVIKARVTTLLTPAEEEGDGKGDADKTAAEKKVEEACADKKKKDGKTAKDGKKDDEKKTRAEVLKTKALEYLRTWLTEKTVETAESKLDKIQGRITEKQKPLIDAIFSTKNAFEQARKSGELSAMLTSLAYVRYQEARAKSALQYEKNKKALAQEKLEAGLAEFRWLARAHKSLAQLNASLAKTTCEDNAGGMSDLLAQCGKSPDVKRAVSEAMAAFTTSTSAGRLPAVLAEYKRLQNERDFALTTEENAATAQYAVLLPLADQLEAYGKGGIRREALIGLLQADRKSVV